MMRSVVEKQENVWTEVKIMLLTLFEVRSFHNGEVSHGSEVRYETD